MVTINTEKCTKGLLKPKYNLNACKLIVYIALKIVRFSETTVHVKC